MGAGGSNTIARQTNAPSYDLPNESAIVSGLSNTISAPLAFIGAGSSNSVFQLSTVPVFDGSSAFIGAGYNNAVGGNFSSIVGGQLNTISADNAAIGGGYKNSVSGEYAWIGSGYGNVASGLNSTVGGGYSNVAIGQNATVPGGASNVASAWDTFAAGLGSSAVTSGSFVWSDYSTNRGLTSSAANQFLARAAGGFYLYSAADLNSGVRLAPGSGSWSSLSDRAAKTDVESVNNVAILAKVAWLPISEWSYSAQGNGVRHLGPMAQDFRTAFGLGEDDEHISAVDEEGVALAAIKALQAEIAEKDRQIAEMRRVADSNFARLERRLDVLEANSHGTNGVAPRS
jgi:hypothetical protein